jgi:Flp pilus assembly protein protease CpaA
VSGVLLQADAPPRVDQAPPVRRPRGARVCFALIFLVGIAITGIFAHREQAKPGVYWADVNVVFLPPQSAVHPNALTTGAGGLVPLAGLVARLVDPYVPNPRVVSPEVSLANQGIRRGYAVTLPNDGGQWADNFDRPLLDVQAVGPTRSGVNARMQHLLRDIAASLAALQDRAHVATVNRVRTGLSPAQLQISYLQGRTSRAVLTTLALGLGLTVTFAVWVDRFRRRRQSARMAMS